MHFLTSLLYCIAPLGCFIFQQFLPHHLHTFLHVFVSGCPSQVGIYVPTYTIHVAYLHDGCIMLLIPTVREPLTDR
ncbi:hypothetical protein F4678DRAFT_416996 [Xylaria arbuscula]|nr:hypothetical protein F4678DRAFT_416996 [Xylaria arbuscula]